MAETVTPTHAVSAAEKQADICIIGAGSSGMTVAKSLQERGLAVQVFEKGSDIGGMWRYENDNGQSSCYASLHIDTSRPNLGYSDFPLDETLPDFPSHRQFLAHLERYADHFGLRKLVRFRTEVAEVIPKDGRFDVRLATGEVLNFGTVIVANGHLADPQMPDFSGSFNGPVIHSHHYRNADPYEGKRVMVVGLGNSAVDIAVDIARRTEHVFVSTRRSGWVIPKYLWGIPIDQVSAGLSRRLRLPTKTTRLVMSWLIRLGVGDQRRFNLPRPAHPMWREHATLSQELLPYIGHGYISVKPNVKELRGDSVAFADGSTEKLDAIIFATGYKITFPFLPETVFDPAQEVGALYRRMVSLKYPGLIFAGLVQPVGPTIPLVEIQGKWIAAYLSGAMRMPDRAARTEEIERHQQVQRKTYLDSKRYVLEVDFKTFSGQMRRDMAAGKAGKA
ncbi:MULTISPECIES: flavin-containing monooxygenase [Roseobacteraceae]|uniref:Trimethylamine monooxygenase n=1 Tax=Pseudosulfitobacter pseudonitzschiae TaxID=1402135 RepID=A0A221K7E5_9RHOB|nr:MULTISPECIES: NAD(P)-binding domain-containing protein [Roseobacteraceae]ASM74921.1 Baeyer-Villiger monooxygenase [Pseudosulfitobacter pseudonitzschiae]